MGNVNIGLAIEQRMNELGLSKSELGKRIGVPQQNINRILAKSSIDTERLQKICVALDFDFFSLYSPASSVRAVASGDGSVAVTGNNNVAGNVTMGDAAVLQERVSMLERLIEEKERTIKILMER